MTPDDLTNLTDALNKLEQITAENRAYLMTPAEAAALQNYIRQHGVSASWLLRQVAILTKRRRGMAAVGELVEKELQPKQVSGLGAWKEDDELLGLTFKERRKGR
jgi:hypothetical protein